VDRITIAIHPIVRTELRRLLTESPELLAAKDDYSEFIMRAIRQWEQDHAS